jgi:uncharacterized protein (TIGR03067 family)
MSRFSLLVAALFSAAGFAVSGATGALADDRSELEKELTKFQGTWTIESSVTGGTELPAEDLKGFIVTFEGKTHTVKRGKEVIQVGTQMLDPSQSPKAIDVTMTEGPNKGAGSKSASTPRGRSGRRSSRAHPAPRTSSTFTGA